MVNGHREAQHSTAWPAHLPPYLWIGERSRPSALPYLAMNARPSGEGGEERVLMCWSSGSGMGCYGL